MKRTPTEPFATKQHTCLTALLLLGIACDSGAASETTQAQPRTESATPTSPPSPEPAASQGSESPATERDQPLELGATIPLADRAMKNVDDSETTIASVAGEHGTLVVFTCNHCPWAQAWEGRITTLGNDYSERGVGVIAINANDPTEYPEDGFEPMQERARAAGMQFPYVVDATSEVARAFGAQKTPETFLFDAEGKLVYQGAIDDNAHEPENVASHHLRDALESLVNGQPIANPRTRAMGCSIKLRSS